ncbi:MAG: phage/plasmid primase, P4 family [Pseudomonadota bacterium]
MSEHDPLGAAALAYAQRGWHVFPLEAGSKGRRPDGTSSHLLTHGHNDATDDAARVSAWWRRWPDANIGLSLAASGLVGVDVDLYKPECGWNAAVARYDLPETFTQASPRGGLHFVFSASPDDTFPAKLCSGVDLKHRGYILLGPSVFEGRSYQVTNDAAPAPCPDWVPRKGVASHSHLAFGSPAFEKTGASEVEELLSWIDPDAHGYDAWLEVLQALHAHFDGGAEGLQLAEAWSSQGAKYNPGEVPAKWVGFDANGGVTLATVAHRARQGGADLGAIARARRGATPRGDVLRATGVHASNGHPAARSDLSHDALAIELGEESFDRDARFVASQNTWYFWTGTCWRADRRLEHVTRVRAFLRARGRALLAVSGSSPPASVVRRVDQLKSNATVAAVAGLARGNPASAIEAEDFDRDVLLLGTPDGTVDLRSGCVRPARRDDLISRQTRLGPAPPGTRATLWLSFLNEIMDGDAEAIDFLQRAAGYALTGATNEHKLLFLHGSGRNGKSVFLNTLLDLWGDYGRRVAAGTLLSSHAERHPTDLAGLRGARLAVASELPRGKCWDEAVIKDLTGGDRMTARFMRQDFFEFDPQLTLLVAGNAQPSFRGVDVAIRSRVVLVPFAVTIPPDRQDRGLEAKLKAEAPAILRWCVDGAIIWQRRGLDVPKRLLRATDDYFDDEDIVGQFLREATTDDPLGFAGGAELIFRFNQWADLQGLASWSQTTLLKELRGRGYQDHRTSRSRGLKGLRLA